MPERPEIISELSFLFHESSSLLQAPCLFFQQPSLFIQGHPHLNPEPSCFLKKCPGKLEEDPFILEVTSFKLPEHSGFIFERYFLFKGSSSFFQEPRLFFQGPSLFFPGPSQLNSVPSCFLKICYGNEKGGSEFLAKH